MGKILGGKMRKGKILWEEYGNNIGKTDCLNLAVSQFIADYAQIKFVKHA